MTATRKPATHANSKDLGAIAYASESVHALLCGAILIAQQDQNKTMTRVLELALGQIDDLDVALAAFQEGV